MMEHGAVREVWFAERGAPDDKWSFLIRDDAYSKRGATYGRAVRLGDPIDLSPKSTWVQTTWQGGGGQAYLEDEQMFHKGNVDTRSKGVLKPYYGLREIAGATYRGVSRWTVQPFHDGTNNLLYLGECLREENDPGGTAPWRLMQFNPATGQLSTVVNFDYPITAICPHNDEAANPADWLAIGLSNGEIWFHRPSDGNTFNENSLYTERNTPIHVDTLTPFKNALYWGAGRQLWKRTATKSGETYTVTYARVADVNTAHSIRALTVWNNQLWFASVTNVTNSKLWVTDGTTTVQAVQLPRDFEVMDMTSHAGWLFIVGRRRGPNGTMGEVYRYSGSTLERVWNVGTGRDGQGNGIWSCASWGDVVWWGSNGSVGTGYYAGIIGYDPKEDAIHYGPALKAYTNQQVRVDSLTPWGDTLVFSMLDSSVNGGEHTPATCVAATRWDTNRGNHYFTPASGGLSWYLHTVNGTGVTYVESSEYDAKLPGEPKVWLNIRLKTRFYGGSTIGVYTSVDGGDWKMAGVLGNTAGKEGKWVTTSFPLLDGVENQRGLAIRYKLEFTCVDFGTDVPEVGAVEVDYIVAPVKRREWRLRIYADDNQKRLGGSWNPLATTKAIRDKVEAMWTSKSPLLYWDASAQGEPQGDPALVFVSDYLDQPYRLDTGSDTEQSEVSVTLTELA